MAVGGRFPGKGPILLWAKWLAETISIGGGHTPLGHLQRHHSLWRVDVPSTLGYVIRKPGKLDSTLLPFETDIHDSQ